MKILIAEDDRTSRLVLEATLRKDGHEVRSTTDGEQAWNAYLDERASLVISDWMMPDLDGLGFTRLIRGLKQPRYTYIILVTALTGRANYLEAMEAGVDDFITKPYDSRLLTARLRVAERILSLQAEVKQLEGLLPMCAYCRKVRDEDAWMELEAYIASCTDASLSHGVCPSCYETQLKPQIEYWKDRVAPVGEGSGG